MASPSKLWPDGRVPYVISDVFTDEQRDAITAAMGEIMEKTCITWVAKTDSDNSYVMIDDTVREVCLLQNRRFGALNTLEGFWLLRHHRIRLWSADTESQQRGRMRKKYELNL